MSKVFVSDKIRYLTMTDASKVWMPDTFFRNEKIGRFHSILTPNLYVRVFPNGNVLYSIRLVNATKFLYFEFTGYFEFYNKV